MRKHNRLAFRLGLVALGAGALALTACTAGTDPGSGPSASSSAPVSPVASASASAVALPTVAASAAQPTAPTTPASSPEPTYACADTQDWTTGPKSVTRDPVGVPLYLVRAGRHDCYDRIVFDVNGSVDVGYDVHYVSAVHADPSDKVVPLPGGAFLQVTIAAPIQGTDVTGHQPWRSPPQLGDDLVAPAQFSGLPSLKAAKFAGSWENVTTIGVGVDSRLAFQVHPWKDGAVTHLIVDVAHAPTK